jgi:hypothetical protein
MPTNTCLFDLNTKQCDLQELSYNKEIYLIVLHEGAEKRQRIELILPKDTYF